MNCHRASHLLSAYIDGELCGVEHRQIHDHLAHCEECRNDYESLLMTKRMLSRLCIKEPANQLPERIHSRIDQEADMLADPWPIQTLRAAERWFRQSSPVPQGVALGAGVALIGVFWFSAHVQHHESSISWSRISSADLHPAPSTPIPNIQSRSIPAPELRQVDLNLRSMRGRRPQPSVVFLGSRPVVMPGPGR